MVISGKGSDRDIVKALDLIKAAESSRIKQQWEQTHEKALRNSAGREISTGNPTPIITRPEGNSDSR